MRAKDYAFLTAANHEAGHAIALHCTGGQGIARIFDDSESHVSAARIYHSPVFCAAGFVAEAMLCPFDQPCDVESLLAAWREYELAEKINPSPVDGDYPTPWIDPHGQIVGPSDDVIGYAQALPSLSDVEGMPQQWGRRRQIVTAAREMLLDHWHQLKWFRDALLVFGSMHTDALNHFDRMTRRCDDGPVVGADYLPSLTFTYPQLP